MDTITFRKQTVLDSLRKISDPKRDYIEKVVDTPIQLTFTKERGGGAVIISQDEGRNPFAIFIPSPWNPERVEYGFITGYAGDIFDKVHLDLPDGFTNSNDPESRERVASLLVEVVEDLDFCGYAERQYGIPTVGVEMLEKALGNIQ